KTREIDQALLNLDAGLKDISADLQYMAVNNDQQIIKAQMFAIMDALKESGIEPQTLLQRYPQQFQYSGVYNQMHGMPHQGLPQGMEGQQSGQGIPSHFYNPNTVPGYGTGYMNSGQNVGQGHPGTGYM